MSDWTVEASYRAPDPDVLPPLMALVFDYWCNFPIDNRIRPAWRDFELMALPARAIPWCSVVDVRTDPLDFIYRFFGTARLDMHGSEVTS